MLQNISTIALPVCYSPNILSGPLSIVVVVSMYQVVSKMSPSNERLRIRCSYWPRLIFRGLYASRRLTRLPTWRLAGSVVRRLGLDEGRRESGKMDRVRTDQKRGFNIRPKNAECSGGIRKTSVTVASFPCLVCSVVYAQTHRLAHNLFIDSTFPLHTTPP